MQVNISGQHIDVTPALKNYILEKTHKLDNHVEKIKHLDIVLHVEKLRHKASANILIKGTTIHATSESEDMYAAIDLLIDKLDRQVIKYKEKQQGHGE